MCLVGDDPTVLHTNRYVMIKYTRNGHSRPREKVFKIDNQDLVMVQWWGFTDMCLWMQMIMWRKTETSKFDQSRTCELLFVKVQNDYLSLLVLTEHIVDVREGQQSSGFCKYSFTTEMNDRSFSIFVEVEKKCKLMSILCLCVYEQWYYEPQ